MSQVPRRGLPGCLLLHALRRSPRRPGVAAVLRTSQADGATAAEEATGHRHRLLRDHTAHQSGV